MMEKFRVGLYPAVDLAGWILILLLLNDNVDGTDVVALVTVWLQAGHASRE